MWNGDLASVLADGQHVTQGVTHNQSLMSQQQTTLKLSSRRSPISCDVRKLNCCENRF